MAVDRTGTSRQIGATTTCEAAERTQITEPSCWLREWKPAAVRIGSMPRWLNLVFWPLFGLYLVIIFGKDAKLKRTLFPIVLIGLGGAFVAAVWTASPLGPVALALVPVLAGAFYLLHRAIRFCDECGKTVAGSMLSPPRFCTACGASLTEMKHG